MMTVNFHTRVNSDNNTSCILSFFFQNLSCVTNPNSHQTANNNRNCYYTSPIREQTSENNILRKLAN